jgi:prepilin-type N-terminal cleavage/methylation domain-containing protein
MSLWFDRLTTLSRVEGSNGKLKSVKVERELGGRKAEVGILPFTFCNFHFALGADRPMNHRKGFTLVEVIVVLAIIAILAAMAVPAALRIFQVTAESTTNQEMDNIKKAILGDPSKAESGVRSDFGYLGDMGCLPTPTGTAGLTSLSTQGALPGWVFNAAAQIGSGWKQPYITGAATGPGAEVFTKDQWGNDYVYTIAGACPLTATFTSNGPDGAAGGGDDIDYSFVANDTTATVSGYVVDVNNNPVANSTVVVNYPGGAAGPGVLTTATTTANAAGRFAFAGVSVPFGKRSLTVTPKLVVTSARAFPTGTTDGNCGTTAGNCSIVDFMLINYSTAVVSVTSITPTYSGGAFFYRVEWAGTVLACGGLLTCPAPNTASMATGEVGTFAARTVGAATAALAPFVFFATAAQTEVNPIKIGLTGGGTVARIRLLNFRNTATGVNAGAQVSVAGVPFSIAFSDGSIVQFTPP